MAAAVCARLDSFTVCVNGEHLLYAFQENTVGVISETHHNNGDHQGGDTDQINLI